MTDLAARSLIWKQSLMDAAKGVADEHAGIPALRPEDV